KRACGTRRCLVCLLTHKSSFTGSNILRLSSKYPLAILFNQGSHCPEDSVDQHVAVNPVNARLKKGGIDR
ncbi:hypothetical protein, partial [uncultured Parabacteroides sp.]|uniref:hypothetical protein n=1 Tax=uncultured Parabacteroides sp. TaxID=512312 RepID=UPI0026DD5C42